MNRQNRYPNSTKYKYHPVKGVYWQNESRLNRVIDCSYNHPVGQPVVFYHHFQE